MGCSRFKETEVSDDGVVRGICVDGFYPTFACMVKSQPLADNLATHGFPCTMEEQCGRLYWRTGGKPNQPIH